MSLSYFKTLGQFSKSDNSIFNAKYSKNIDEDEKFNEFLEGFINAKFTVQTVEKKPISRKPSAPFTTSTLQQEASRKLGFNVARTMQAAQKLYEAGHITT